MKRAAIVALALAGCATFRPGEFSRLGSAPVECQQRPYEGRTRVECRALGAPRTARAMLVGEEGEVLESRMAQVTHAASR